MRYFLLLILLFISTTAFGQNRTLGGIGGSVNGASVKASVQMVGFENHLLYGFGFGRQFDHDFQYFYSEPSHERISILIDKTDTYFFNMQVLGGTNNFYLGLGLGLGMYKSHQYVTNRAEWLILAAYIPSWWGVKLDYNQYRNFGAEFLFTF